MRKSSAPHFSSCTTLPPWLDLRHRQGRSVSAAAGCLNARICSSRLRFMDWVQLAQICPLEPDHMTQPAPCTLLQSTSWSVTPSTVMEGVTQHQGQSGPPKCACVRAHACVRDANIIQRYYLTAALLCHCCTTEGSDWLQNQEMLGNIKENISDFRLCRGFRRLRESARIFPI